MGRIPADDYDRIRSRSPEVQHLLKAVAEAEGQLEWDEVQQSKDPSDPTLRKNVDDANEGVRRAREDVDAEIDFQYRSELVDDLEVDEADRAAVHAFEITGPWGHMYFDVERTVAGAKLAAYLGVRPDTLLNGREKTSADSFLSSNTARAAAASQTTWGGTVDWIAQVLFERRRRSHDAHDSFARRMAQGPRAAAVWVPPRISFLNTMFMPHMTMLDNAPPCPRCRNLLLPMNPDKDYVYCGHCAQGYRMYDSDGSVELAALHYDCPGCGLLHGVPEAGRPGACHVCGTLPTVSLRYGTARYADPKQEKKDSGKGLFADKKRYAQLQRWRRDSSGRVEESLDGLADRFAEWEADFIWAAERLPIENSTGWHLYRDDLAALSRYSFTFPSEEDLPRLRHDFHQQSLADLEEELIARYEWGVPLTAVADLVKQYPWARDLIERLSRT